MTCRTAISALGLFFLLATRVAEAGATVTLKAVKKNNVAITPTTEVIGAAGNVFECEFYIAGWADSGYQARGYDFRVAGVTGAGDGDVLPVGWDAPITPQPCNTNLDCHDPAFQLCYFMEFCFGTMHHPEQGAFVTMSRPDFILAGLGIIFGGVGTPTLDYIWGETLQEVIGRPDLGGSYYAGTLKLQIKPGACGDYVWRTVDGPDSFLVPDQPIAIIVPLVGIPLNIHVAPLHDCSDDRLHLFSEFANCFTASGGQLATKCSEFDRDDDGDVGIADYVELFAP
ncbi:MAG: hypothetical protein HY287_00210 [Planctomycetes bacterium]|nr:hypothetical protein [Planctomycetota bacterium]MBI3832735.1 hypothetical protein [Planctomycetota bacterium]